jgi:hypothetical protein
MKYYAPTANYIKAKDMAELARQANKAPKDSYVLLHTTELTRQGMDEEDLRRMDSRALKRRYYGVGLGPTTLVFKLQNLHFFTIQEVLFIDNKLLSFGNVQVGEFAEFYLFPKDEVIVEKA